MNAYQVAPDSKFKLKNIDAGSSKGDKEKIKAKILQLTQELEALQELLYAEHRHKVLVVLQAMDTGGKDGVIRHVFDNVNPQGVRVASFKKPTPLELDHDYLWRVHQQAPAKGEMVIFNRSHYEDVLVVAVHKLAPEKVWSRRYDQINNFERMLVEEGVTILKFFLHIDLEEQKERLQARLADPDKQWKFNPADLEERKFWPEYMKAYEEVLQRTSTSWAPWYVIPSNKKWFRNYVISSILVKTLQGLKMNYPQVDYDPTAIQVI
jgi:PPK2 family polyphosphate:nucleotide phosphotransferase